MTKKQVCSEVTIGIDARSLHRAVRALARELGASDALVDRLKRLIVAGNTDGLFSTSERHARHPVLVFEPSSDLVALVSAARGFNDALRLVERNLRHARRRSRLRSRRVRKEASS